MKPERRFDPRTSRAIEEAEGIEVFEESPRVDAILLEHEEAQGVDLFVAPDGAIPPTLVREGAPGQESLSADSAGFEFDDEATYERPDADEYAEA